MTKDCLLAFTFGGDLLWWAYQDSVYKRGLLLNLDRDERALQALSQTFGERCLKAYTSVNKDQEKISILEKIFRAGGQYLLLWLLAPHPPIVFQLHLYVEFIRFAVTKI